MEDIQSWWELPSIAHFCSLFRAAFDLLDFDIEELEEAVLTDGLDGSGSPLLIELLVRLIQGCLPGRNVNSSNYDSYLKKLFRQKCQSDASIQNLFPEGEFRSLPLRKKVEILHYLCDFRLEAEDVLDLLKNLETESLRVEPLGFDDQGSTYWYFYGTRLYREDNSIFHPFRRRLKEKEKYNKKRKRKKHGNDEILSDSSATDDESLPSSWQVQCFSEEDWRCLSDKFEGCDSRLERSLLQTLKDDFLPEIPRLFEEKEKIQQKRIKEFTPRRTSGRVQKLREKKQIEGSVVDLKKDSETDGGEDITKLHETKEEDGEMSNSFLVKETPIESLDLENCSRLAESLEEAEENDQNCPIEAEDRRLEDISMLSRNKSSVATQKTKRKSKTESDVDLFDKRKERWRDSEEFLQEDNTVSVTPDPSIDRVEGSPSHTSDPPSVKKKNNSHKVKKDGLKKPHRRKYRRKIHRSSSRESMEGLLLNDAHHGSSDVSNKENRCSIDSISGTDDDGDNLSQQPQLYKGRKTNNSLSSLAFSLTPTTVVPDPPSQMVSPPPTKKKVKSAHMLLQTEDDLRTGMYKVLEHLRNHEDAWPFLDAVDDSFAPNYYAVIRRPMYIARMESRLDNGFYSSLPMFEVDFKLMMDNCKLYNGPDSEYTHMAYTLEKVFEKLKSKYLESEFSSDEEIYIDMSFQQTFKRKKRRSTEEKENLEIEETKKKRGRLKKKKVGRKPKVKNQPDDETEKIPKRSRGRPRFTDKHLGDPSKEGEKKKKSVVKTKSDESLAVNSDSLHGEKGQNVFSSDSGAAEDDDYEDDFEEPLLLVREDPYPETDEESDRFKEAPELSHYEEEVVTEGVDSKLKNSLDDDDLKFTSGKVSLSPYSSPRSRKNRGRTTEDDATQGIDVAESDSSNKKAQTKRGRPSKKDLESRRLKQENRGEIPSAKMSKNVDLRKERIGSDSDSDSDGGVFLYYNMDEDRSSNEEEETEKKTQLSNELFGEIDDIEDELEADDDEITIDDRAEKKRTSEKKKNSELKEKKRKHHKHDSGDKHHRHHHHHKHRNKSKNGAENNTKRHHHHKKRSHRGSGKNALPSDPVTEEFSSRDFPSNGRNILEVDDVFDHSDDGKFIEEDRRVDQIPLTPPTPNGSTSPALDHNALQDEEDLVHSSTDSHSKKKRSKRKCKHDKKNKHKPNRSKSRDKPKDNKHEKRNSKKRKGLKRKKKHIPHDKMAAINALSAATEQTLKDITSLLDDPDVPRFAGESPPQSPTSDVDTKYENFDSVSSNIELEYRKKLQMEPDKKLSKKKRKGHDNNEDLPKKKKVKSENFDNKENDKKFDREKDKELTDFGILDNTKELFKDIKDGRIKPGAIIKSKDIAKREGVVKKETKIPSESKIKAKPNPFGKINKQENSKLTSLIAKAKESRLGLVPNSELGDSPKLSLGSIILFGDIGSRKHSVREPNSADEEEPAYELSDKVEKWDNGRWEKVDVKDEYSDPPSQSMEQEEEQRVETEEEEKEIPSPASERMIVDDLVPPLTPRGLDFRQERATPNLSAWFKAFGGPKVSTPSAKRSEGDEDRDPEEVYAVDIEEEENAIMEEASNNTSNRSDLKDSWEVEKRDLGNQNLMEGEDKEEEEEEIKVCSPAYSIPENPLPSPQIPCAVSPEPPHMSPPSPELPISPGKPPPTPWFDKVNEKEDEPIWKKNKADDDEEDQYQFEEEELDRAREEAKKMEVERQRKASVSSSGLSDPSPLNIDSDRSPAAFSSEGERSPLTRSPATRSPLTPGFGSSTQFSPVTEKSPIMSAYSPRFDCSIGKSFPSYDEKNKYQANGSLKVGFYQDVTDKGKEKSDQSKSLDQKFKESPIYSPTVPYVSPLYSGKDQNISKQKSPGRYNNYYTSIDSSTLDKLPPTPGYYSSPAAASTPSDKTPSTSALDDKSKAQYNYYSYDPTKSLTDQYKSTCSSSTTSKPFFPGSENSLDSNREKSSSSTTAQRPEVMPPSVSSISSVKPNEKTDIPPPKKRQNVDKGPHNSFCDTNPLSLWGDKREEIERTLSSAPFRNPFSPHSLPANLANLSHIVSRIPEPDISDSLITAPKESLKLGSDQAHSQSAMGKSVQPSHLYDLPSHSPNVVPVPDLCSPLGDFSHISNKSLVPPAAHQKTPNETERPGSRSVPPPPGEKSHSYLHPKTMWNSSIPCSIPSSLTSLVSNAAMASIAFGGQKGLGSFPSDPLAQFGMDRAALASLTSRSSQGASQLFHPDLLPRNSSQGSVAAATAQSSPGLSLQSHLNASSGNSAGSHSSKSGNSGSNSSGSGSTGTSGSTSSNSSNLGSTSSNFDLSLARSYANFMNANQSLVRNEASSSFLNQSQSLGAALGMVVSSSRTPTPAHQQSFSQSNFPTITRNSREPISQSHSSMQIPNLNSISSSQNQSLGHINPVSLASYTSRDSLALMTQASRNPLVGVDPTSQIYQQYLQRHQLAQEELLLRSAGAHSQLAHQSMMLQQGLMSAAAASYPSGYPHSLGLRSGPYQGMNRPWI